MHVQMSNADQFAHNHDEIDFELLGFAKRRQWVLQTNMYGNGSVKTGREEKVYLWFDPTQQFHQYTILWNKHHIVYVFLITYYYFYYHLSLRLFVRHYSIFS
ncbi:putative glycoside hydrolase family 16, concanavalin A-like lectin/glucanase domain superfamily [Helianthus annuus]|nr:putative glycoside hydrolase family 16, concanavalin A-like lectin/glucanase domain superfamily [Helianthus annuus]